MKSRIKSKREIDTVAARELLGKNSSDELFKLEAKVKYAKCKDTRLRQIPKDDKFMI